MSEVKEYNGELKDIIIPIPSNAIEMTIKLKVYENGKMFDAEQTLLQWGISRIYVNRKG